jgi:hypothetical protein
MRSVEMTGSRVRLTGSIRVELPPEEAFGLFTPNGERAWAHGWAPEFPSPPDDDSEPGTAFTTRHGGQDTIWTVAGREPGRSIRYVSTIPGRRTGLITVTCAEADGGTEVTVSYDLTALDPSARADLRRFADGYPGFLAHWERALADLTKAIGKPLNS